MNAEYVAQMEHVLDIYSEPADDKRPVVNFDEAMKLNQQCLDRRMGDRDFLISELKAREKHRNQQKASINWMFDVDADMSGYINNSWMGTAIILKITFHCRFTNPNLLSRLVL